VTSACKAVTPAIGTLAISGKSIPSGMMAQTLAGAQVYSAKAPPLSVSPNTLSPTLICSTLLPTSSTIPAKSAPRILTLGLNNPKENRAKKGFPRRICQSAGLAEFAITFTRI